MPDGTYETVGNVIKLLAGPQKTIAQLRAIAGTISAAREVVARPEASVEKIKREVPELASIADALPRNRTELYGFLTVLLMAISTIIAAAAMFRDQGPSDVEVERMIEETIERAFRNKPVEEKQQPHRAVPKPGRNDPCPCGSGKKYKHCCLKLV